MKRLTAPLLMMIVLCAAGTSLFAQTDSLVLTWQRELDPGTALRTSHFIAATTDAAGNIFAVGSTESAQGESDLLVVKYDPLGQELWQATYDGPLHSHDAARWVFATQDGGVTVVGVCAASEVERPYFIEAREGLVIARFAADGLRMWARVIVPPSDSVYRTIRYALSDHAEGLYVLVTEQVDTPWYYAQTGVVLRISATGDLVKEIRLPNVATTIARSESMVLTTENELLVVDTRIDSTWYWGFNTTSCLYTYGADGTLLGTIEQSVGQNISTRAIGFAANPDGALKVVAFETDSLRYLRCYDTMGIVRWERVIDTLSPGSWFSHAEPILRFTADSVLWSVRGGVGQIVERFSPSGDRLTMWVDSTVYTWYPVSAWEDGQGGLRTLRVIATIDDLPNDTLVAACFGPDGSRLWRVGIPLQAELSGEGACVDAAGNFYPLSKSGSIRNSHAIIAKIAPNGSVQWTNHHSADGSANASVVGMTRGPSGALFLTGTAVNTRGFFDLFTAKVSAQGDPEWVRIYDGPEGRHEIPVGVLSDGSGSVYTAGYVPGRGYPSTGSYVVVKYASTGELCWVAQHAGTAAEYIPFELRDVYLDAQARLWLAGSAGTLCVDSTGTLVRQDMRSSWAVTSDTAGRVFIAGQDSISAFGPAGDLLWVSSTQLWGEPPLDMVPDGVGGVVVTCGDYHTFRMDSTGARLWSKGFGTTKLFLDSEQNIFIVGRWGGAAKLSMAGDSIYYIPYQRSDLIIPVVAALGGQDHVYLAGEEEYSNGGLGSGHIWLSNISPEGAVSARNSYVGPAVAYIPQAMCAGSDGGVYVASDVYLLGMSRLPVIQKYEHLTVGVPQQDGEVPGEFSLSQNYPNPFNGETRIGYRVSGLGSGQSVTLKIYDVLGREVAALVGEVKPAGHYTVRWNASGAASGVYFYRLSVGDISATRKMILMK